MKNEKRRNCRKLNNELFGLTRNSKRLHFDEKNLYIFSIMDIYINGLRINANPQNPYTNKSHINLYDLDIDTSLDDIIEINKRIIEALNK